MESEQQARDRELEAWVKEIRIKQGLPAHIEDPLVLRQLITLLGLADTTSGRAAVSRGSEVDFSENPISRCLK